MVYSPATLIPEGFDPLPGLVDLAAVSVTVGPPLPDAEVVGIFVAAGGPVPGGTGFDLAALESLGFTAKPAEAYVVPQKDGPVLVFVGVGDPEEVTTTRIRDAAAALVRAVPKKSKFSLVFSVGVESTVDAGQALAEGVLLANYRYTALKAEPAHVPIVAVSIEVQDADQGDVLTGVGRAAVTSRAAIVARDLTNTPPAHLTATALGIAAQRLGDEYGFEVEVFDKAQLIELGTGGILGVNRGSVEEPRLVKLRYAPQDATAHLGLVGKGITYDSGGISLKPSNPMHALMKMDMGGAAAVLGAFTGFRDLGVSVEVTGWLAVTDNMPSGSALKLGDVLTVRGGTTVEVLNTDAEGRLVMSDAIVLANEAGVDAIIDIATLTGAAQAALGQSTAAILGNDQGIVDLVTASSAVTDEPLWQLPLERKYRPQLDSKIADISNMGGPYAGATIAALFLDHFVDGTPWAHLDIAGTMAVDKDDSWRTTGATGFGARTLLQVAANFEKPE